MVSKRELRLKIEDELQRHDIKERGPKTVRQSLFLNLALLPEHHVEVEYVRTQST